MRPGPSLTSTIEMPCAASCADTNKVHPVEWFPYYQNCVRYFLDVAQHTPSAQSLAAYLNISLPCQRAYDPVLRYSEASASLESDYRSASSVRSGTVSIIPYIRRLVVTAMDTPNVLQGLFGDDWKLGIGHLHSQERINYLFAAKSGGWLSTKSQYDILPDETVPFLRPLRDPQEEEIRAAEARWSDWLAMEDWMIRLTFVTAFDTLTGGLPG
ncbi:hypothetical protein T310_7631 [Rasamsonia emersonii CBS 393.64]|uniref:Uncharacterized protein n=1 Tax=Rasamsonia emersonii (strain ATCC 16479 / CBS 393.64 / IMI 116815) TaxID=1408163 RepID=A0A0F4YKM3_RASE3|nr:hypothetical protein T310_7631 [Rasamsonia emersonii CBS 393.64]KKA18426.1 hypothetical protein T310_7631 [Rasamsonia emersonii CBS 393.64]